MSIKKQYIPAPLASAVKNGYVTDTSEILDENKGKRQDVINQETNSQISGIKGGSAKSIAQIDAEINGNGGIDDRLGTVEQLAEISIGGGDAQIATGEDFTNPDATKRAKVPTVGAVLDGMNDGVYDVSKRNPTGGENSDGKFTLAYILANADTLIPTSWRHGGMSISFVSSVDNKYVQYRYMGTSTAAADFTNTANWQGVDAEPVSGSTNIVESGGVLLRTRSNFIKGVGRNIYSSTKSILLPNHYYRLTLSNNVWAHTSATSGALFNIAAVSGSTETAIVTVAYNGAPEKVYEFKTPSTFDYIRIGGRADVGVNIEFTIEDAEPFANIATLKITKEMLNKGYWPLDNTGRPSINSTDLRTIGFVNVTPNTLYRVIGIPDGVKLSVICYQADGTYIQSGSFWFGFKDRFVTPNNCLLVHIQFRNTDGIDISTFPDVTVENDTAGILDYTSSDASSWIASLKTLTIGNFENNISLDMFNSGYKNRAATQLMPLTNGKITVSINDGYSYGIEAYNTKSRFFDSGWQTEEKEYYITGMMFYVAIKRNDNANLTSEDLTNCGLSISCNYIHQSVAGIHTLLEIGKGIDSKYDIYINPSFNRDLSNQLFRFTTLKFGVWGDITNNYPVLSDSHIRAATDLIPLGYGEVKISIKEGYGFSFKKYDCFSNVYNSDWIDDGEEHTFNIDNSIWCVNIRKSDNSQLNNEDLTDCELNITALTPLYATVGSVLGDFHIKKELGESKKEIEDLKVNTNRIIVEPWYHYFIRKITNSSSNIVVPSQSLADIHVAKMVGAKFMEFNILLTSDDVPICRHGINGNKVSGLIDSNGDDVEIENIRQVSYSDLIANYRYKSEFPQFRTPLTSLEDALKKCNELDIIPIIQYDSRIVSLIEKYRGNRWVAYVGSSVMPTRPAGLNKDVPCMVSFWSNNPYETVTNYLLAADDFGYGSAFPVYLSFLKSLTDNEAAAFIQAMVAKGVTICVDEYTSSLSADYADIMKYVRMGAKVYHEFSLFDTDYEIVSLCDALNNFQGISGTYTTGEGCIVVSDGNTVSIAKSKDAILSAVELVINYSGSLKITVGEYLNEVAVSSANDGGICELSTILEDLNSTVTIKSVGTSNIYSITHKYKKCI